MKITETLTTDQVCELILKAIDLPEKMSFKSRNIQVDLHITANTNRNRMMAIAYLQERLRDITSKPERMTFNQQVLMSNCLEE